MRRRGTWRAALLIAGVAAPVAAQQDPFDKSLWRVQTLRNLGHTAPYMHNGSVKSLWTRRCA